jgi:hypothetical protein
MRWCFAMVNEHLAEIYFEKKRGKPRVFGHCYVKPNEYKTKQEQKWIQGDTARLRFIYSQKKYRQILQ